MFKNQRCLVSALKRGFGSRKNFAGRYKVAKEEKYEGIKNKPVYEKAMKRGLDYDPDLEVNDYIEVENDYNSTYNPESEELKTKRLQDFLENKSSIEDKMQSFISEAKNDKEMAIKSEQLINSMRRKDIGSLFAEDSQEIMDQYKRYDYYRKNYVEKTHNSEMKLKDENKLFRDEADHHNEGINEFYNNLDPKITEHLDSEYVAKNIEALNLLKSLETKVELTALTRQAKSENPSYKDGPASELTDLQKKLISTFEETAQKTKNKSSGAIFERQFSKAIDQSAQENPIEQTENMMEKPQLQLSLRAKLEIYRLYIEGWSIKDICMRFGVSPQRTKFVIWNLQYYIEDVLPFSTPEQVIEGIYMELNPEDDDVKLVDYGIDLDSLHRFKAGNEVKVFAKQYMDHIPKTNKEAEMTEKEIDEKIKKTKTKKEDFVIEKSVSGGSTPHYLKNWVVYSGHGMMRVNRMFKAIVERNHYKGHLPHKVVARLEKGPRVASLGFGYK